MNTTPPWLRAAGFHPYLGRAGWESRRGRHIEVGRPVSLDGDDYRKFQTVRQVTRQSVGRHWGNTHLTAALAAVGEERIGGDGNIDLGKGRIISDDGRGKVDGRVCTGADVLQRARLNQGAGRRCRPRFGCRAGPPTACQHRGSRLR